MIQLIDFVISPLPSLATSQSEEPIISTKNSKLTDHISSDVRVYMESSHVAKSSSNSSFLLVGTQVSSNNASNAQSSTIFSHLQQLENLSTLLTPGYLDINEL